MKFLVTGAAGFIGSAVSQRLLAMGHEVVGVDNLNDYYSPALKRARLAQLDNPQFYFAELDIEDNAQVAQLFQTHQFQRVIHLAAQAGVRYSIDNPQAYMQSNFVGMLAILESCRHHQIEHLVYASSSSVYGLNQSIPFAETDSVDHPVSFYAASKKANELMAHSYSHLYQIPTTGLRFFTVYGPWGRPDMALFKFTQKILAGEPIEIFNHGNLFRDFTYIDDIVEGVVRVQDAAPAPCDNWVVESGEINRSSAPYQVFNIGRGEPVRLSDFVDCLEQELGVKAIKEYLPMQAGDVFQTYADTSALESCVDYKPQVSLQQGIREFVNWYRDYYQIER
uniref:NAD-dependent epimerase n=1 Tax=Thaumasiovibrio occultus TaxID=1891184 RepID=UPI000B364555|nr:NAD-dependent epimerase [Thaumasiovibrio occultus]